MDGHESQLDTTIEVVTPENIAFRYQVAGPFRRLPAWLLDQLIRFGILTALMYALSVFAFIGAGGMAFAVGIICYFLLEWFYGSIFETYMNGQTPGKWVLGIRVLSTDGRPINGLQAVLRNVLRAVDAFPLLSVEMFRAEAPMYVIPTFIVGLAVMTLNRRFQRVGDLVCGTMVIIEERYWLTGVAKLEDERAALLAEYLPPDFRVSRSLARTLAAYVDRRRYFSVARRREVARHLAEPLLEKFGMRKDTSHDLLLCALYYRTFIADRAAELHPSSASSPIGSQPDPRATEAPEISLGPLHEHPA